MTAKSGHVVSIIFNIVQWDSYLASMNESVKHNKSLLPVVLVRMNTLCCEKHMNKTQNTCILIVVFTRAM